MVYLANKISFINSETSEAAKSKRLNSTGTVTEPLSSSIDWAKGISIGDNPLAELDWAGVISLERGYYCLILLITIIILGRLWGDSITVNVTSLEPVRTTENRIITQISRILTPEVKWIISVIICLFLYYFYINRPHRRCVKRNHLFVRSEASSSRDRTITSEKLV